MQAPSYTMHVSKFMKSISLFDLIDKHSFFILLPIAAQTDTFISLTRMNKRDLKKYTKKISQIMVK
jgi:hypothetical protein